MTSSPPDTATRASLGLFFRHYLEMVLAMAVGMVAAHPVLMLLAPGSSPAGALRSFTVEAAVMATGMALAMAAWMRIRGHGWRMIVEMTLAMYAGFVLVAPAVWSGTLDRSGGLVVGHILMLVLMLIAMALRRDHYSVRHQRPLL
jgi:hypothetical protein